MNNKIPIRFFVITFLWSWLFFAPSVLVANGIITIGFMSKINVPLIYVGAFGPIVGTIVSLLTTNGKGAVKPFFKSFLSLNFGWKAWLAIPLILGFVTIIAWFIPELFGKNRVSPMMPFYTFPIYLIAMIFIGGGQEEVGWRGYILPFLEKRFRLIIGSLILGIVWAFWHIPLWFAQVGQNYMNFFGYMLACIGFSYILSWIMEASGNRLFSGVVAHGFINAIVSFFPFVIMDYEVKQTRFWIYCILMLIVGMTIVIMRTLKKRKNGI